MRRAWGYLAFLVLVLCGVGIVTLLRIWHAARNERLGPADAIVVFGAAVREAGPSATLRTRTLRGAELYKQGLAPVVVCSGGTSGGASEPQVMADMLVTEGVPPSALVLDEAGVTTRATLASLGALGGGNWRRVLAVSSPFHLFRIAEEASRHGIEALPCPAWRATADGVGAKLRLFLWDARQYGRETVAVWAYRGAAWTRERQRGRHVLGLTNQVRARWRSFAREADQTRQASDELWSLIRARRVEGQPEMAAVPRLEWPVSGRLTSRFGMRHGRMHEGIDIAIPAGAPVHPALRGVVLLAGELEVYGNVVVIGHGRSLATVYAHLGGVEVAREDRVEPERRLGTVGATGRAFGAHLHFEVRFDGTPVDPLVFLGS